MSSIENPDTLTGLPRHFKEIKVAKRFMNDPTPALYMATLLWGTVLPSMSGGEGDVSTSARSSPNGCAMTTVAARRLRWLKRWSCFGSPGLLPAR